MRRSRIAGLFTLALLAGSLTPTLALVQPRENRRFDAVAIPDPAESVSATPRRFDATGATGATGAPGTLGPRSVPGGLRAAWDSFRAFAGPGWELVLDARSGAPLLAQGEGIPWIPGTGNTLSSATPVTLDTLAESLRSFMAGRPELFLAKVSELALNQEGSGQITPDLWQVEFDRQVGGIPVTGDRYVFYIGHGNLIAFGASRWSTIKDSQAPALGSVEAMGRLATYMGLSQFDRVEILDEGTLQFTPMAAESAPSLEWAGPVGQGYRAALTWHFVLTVDGEGGTWAGLVDANTGEVLALYDDNRYAQAKGGVFPLANDAICPTGCEQAGYPMPYADVKINGTPATVSSMGTFTCTPAGGTAVTTLAGTYFKVVDSCGAISVSTTCDTDLDLKTSTGTDCIVPAGTSPGDTHASRSSYYHLNRIRDHARAWLPSNAWLATQVTDNVNLNQTCNAFWNGTLNFFKSGGGCRNTGEIAGIFLHEWGHGLDQNDGGGLENPAEAYADITSVLLTHVSCVGRGFTSSNCGGYGNACLACTGVRDVDWNQRASHTASTPEGFIAGCPSGSSPCGKEGHCEGYLAAETLWDLAVRDLPAAGVDANTAWQITDRLWYKSRQGSGGNAYACGSPASNRSCAATSWMQKLRVVDDDDGNLANGTPHSAAIFAAFNRHNIPCGAAGDAVNQSTSICPAIGTPAVTVTPGPGNVALSWAAVPNATSYNVLRNDLGCGSGFTILANQAGTSYNDTGLANGFTGYYAVQAVGSNTSCLSAVSTCQSATPGGPLAIYQSNAYVADTCAFGGVGNNDGTYDPGEQTQFSVTIKNDGTGTLTGVTVTLTTSTPGVTVIDGTASYNDIPFAGTGASLAPHFTMKFGTSFTCGATITYQFAIHANEGNWTGTFTQRLGLITPSGGTLVSENFSGGIPGAWTVVDGGTGGGAAATWTTANPGARSFATPLVSPVAIVDSANAGGTATQDEQLVTPVLSAPTSITVTLAFDQYFNFLSAGDEIGDVDVKSSRTSGVWTNVFRNLGASSPNPDHQTINISAQAGATSDLQIRFRYYNATARLWWQVDNVVVTYTNPTTCAMHSCIAPASADVSVTKTDAPDPVATQGTITYSMTVANAGPNAATSVQLSDSTPANTTFVSVTKPAAWNCSTPSVGGTGAISCTAASLASGGNAAFTIAVKVKACAGNGTVISSTATVSTTVSDPNAVNNSASTTTTVTDSGVCNDANACTLTDTCQAGVCTGTNPVVCTAADECHDAGTCSPATGLCSNPAKADGTLCNDGAVCTVQDACSGGTCSGAPVPPPPEVNDTLMVTETGGTATITWTDPPGPFNVYRGLNGPSTLWSYNETCFAPNVPGPVTDSDLPPAGMTYFYLVTRKDACGESTPGRASSGEPIVNPVSCPPPFTARPAVRASAAVAPSADTP